MRLRSSPPDSATAEDKHNAVAWLALTDDELIRQSASLGLPGDLHPDPNEVGAVAATAEQLVEARRAADAVAVEHAGKKFVAGWIKENRGG